MRIQYFMYIFYMKSFNVLLRTIASNFLCVLLIIYCGRGRCGIFEGFIFRFFLGGFFPGTGKFTFPTCGVVGAENPIRRLVGVSSL